MRERIGLAAALLAAGCVSGAEFGFPAPPSPSPTSTPFAPKPDAPEEGRGPVADAGTRPLTWRSCDAVVRGPGFARVLDTSGALEATLVLYESDQDNSLAGAVVPFDTFVLGDNVPDNDAFRYSYDVNGAAPDVPYVGSSRTGRAMAAGESGAAPPAGVLDLSMHPPDTERWVVTAFVPPLPGRYEIHDFAARHSHLMGSTCGTVRVDLHGPIGGGTTNLLASHAFVPAEGGAWKHAAGPFTVVAAGPADRIYVIADRSTDLSYGCDAIEFAWTIRRP